MKGGENGLTLLSPGTGSLSSELLGLHSSGVGDQQGSVVLDQSLLELEGGSGVLVLGEVTVYSMRFESACLHLHVDLLSTQVINKSRTHATTPLAIACLKA